MGPCPSHHSFPPPQPAFQRLNSRLGEGFKRHLVLVRNTFIKYLNTNSEGRLREQMPFFMGKEKKKNYPFCVLRKKFVTLQAVWY